MAFVRAHTLRPRCPHIVFEVVLRAFVNERVLFRTVLAFVYPENPFRPMACTLTALVHHAVLQIIWRYALCL